MLSWVEHENSFITSGQVAFSMPNSAKHESFSAKHEIFSANKYENAKNSCHFHIY